MIMGTFAHAKTHLRPAYFSALALLTLLHCLPVAAQQGPKISALSFVDREVPRRAGC